jgi:hypothetical protein
MKIIRCSEGLEFEKYFELSHSDEVESLNESDVEGIDLKCWVLYENLGVDGEITEVLAMEDCDGSQYLTVSRPFITEFVNLLGMCDEYDRKITAIRVIHNTSKRGIGFMTCALAGCE